MVTWVADVSDYSATGEGWRLRPPWRKPPSEEYNFENNTKYHLQKTIIQKENNKTRRHTRMHTPKLHGSAFKEKKVSTSLLYDLGCCIHIYTERCWLKSRVDGLTTHTQHTHNTHNIHTIGHLPQHYPVVHHRGQCTTSWLWESSCKFTSWNNSNSNLKARSKWKGKISCFNPKKGGNAVHA